MLAIDKLGSILSGWKNYAFENQEIEILARERALECAKCELSDVSWYAEVIDDKITDIKGMVCKGCAGVVKCPLSSKLRSKVETCPKSHWKC